MAASDMTGVKLENACGLRYGPTLEAGIWLARAYLLSLSCYQLLLRRSGLGNVPDGHTKRPLLYSLKLSSVEWSANS